MPSNGAEIYVAMLKSFLLIKRNKKASIIIDENEMRTMGVNIMSPDDIMNTGLRVLCWSITTVWIPTLYIYIFIVNIHVGVSLQWMHTYMWGSNCFLSIFDFLWVQCSLSCRPIYHRWPQTWGNVIHGTAWYKEGGWLEHNNLRKTTHLKGLKWGSLTMSYWWESKSSLHLSCRVPALVPTVISTSQQALL